MSIINTVRWINWRLKVASGNGEVKSLNVKSNRQTPLDTIANFAPFVGGIVQNNFDNDVKAYRNNVMDEIIERKVNEIFESTLESKIEEKLCKMKNLLNDRTDETLNKRNKKPA